MRRPELSATLALEACERAGSILPLIESFLRERGEPLSEGQRLALGSALLRAFDGVEETFERMLDTAVVLARFSPFECSVADEAEAWLRDQGGPLQ